MPHNKTIQNSGIYDNLFWLRYMQVGCELADLGWAQVDLL